MSFIQGLPGYLPYEFTYEGMLERVLVYLENQVFCYPDHQWPGVDSLVTIVSKEAESCKDACFREGESRPSGPRGVASLGLVLYSGVPSPTLGTSLNGPIREVASFQG